MPKVIQWNKGPPPSLGWWPASLICDNNVFRWWDGICWSFPASRDHTATRAGKQAAMHSADSDKIRWRDRPATWPDRSRT